jgi:hypothetical protein
VQTATLDALAAGVGAVDLLRVGVQGDALAVLHGGSAAMHAGQRGF